MGIFKKTGKAMVGTIAGVLGFREVFEKITLSIFDSGGVRDDNQAHAIIESLAVDRKLKVLLNEVYGQVRQDYWDLVLMRNGTREELLRKRADKYKVETAFVTIGFTDPKDTPERNDFRGKQVAYRLFDGTDLSKDDDFNKEMIRHNLLTVGTNNHIRSWKNYAADAVGDFFYEIAVPGAKGAGHFAANMGRETVNISSNAVGVARRGVADASAGVSATVSSPIYWGCITFFLIATVLFIALLGLVIWLL